MAVACGDYWNVGDWYILGVLFGWHDGCGAEMCLPGVVDIDVFREPRGQEWDEHGVEMDAEDRATLSGRVNGRFVSISGCILPD
jgi:hypothetical protein